MADRVQLAVSVFDTASRRRSDATVTVGSSEDRAAVVALDPATAAFHVELEAPGTYLITVAIDGLKNEKREVSLQAGVHEEVFILGTEGMRFYYRGRTRVPFEARPERVAIVLASPEELESNEQALFAVARRVTAAIAETPPNVRKNGAILLTLPEAGKLVEAQRAFGELPFVQLVGPVLKEPANNATVLTDTLIARFKSNVTRDTVAALAQRLELQTIRSIPYAANAFQFRVPGPVSYRVLDACETLVESGLVEYAEPDLWHTAQEDLITPTDWLFPEQWDHPIIGTPAAWQTLADIDPGRTFGDPSVIIAIVDSGIDAAHPSFAGNVTSGAPKIYQLFDFVKMVANNNVLPDSHGTCCAGAASAKANDASTVAGVNEGTAGVAGNCRLMGIRKPTTSEATYADMYVWIAGLDPGSTLRRFPAPIAPGADVISNSFGASEGEPISGLMRDTFDFITTHGRGGKGTLVFCSVGNFVPREDFTLRRPWAAYAKTIAIGASAVMDDGVKEGISEYSGFGPGLDLCAPSHDAYVGNRPLHNPPINFAAFTSTIRNTPTTTAAGDANAPGRPTIKTTLSAAAAVGSDKLKVASVTGLAKGQAVFIGKPGAARAEAHVISAIDSAQLRMTIKPDLFEAHAAGTKVFASQADYKNCFGGTSYATPVCAGVAALMLSANPNLTWTEVRDLMETTAVPIDPANTDPVGRWFDSAKRVSTHRSYAGPHFSQWYGFGRVDAAAAVAAAVPA